MTTTYSRTDAELGYWLEKCLLYQGTRSFTLLVIAGGGGSWQIMTAAASQDLIGWMEFLHGKILVDIEAIQQLHCSLQSCRITGPDWMKAMSSHLMQILHSQWIFGTSRSMTSNKGIYGQRNAGSYSGRLILCSTYCLRTLP